MDVLDQAPFDVEIIRDSQVSDTQERIITLRARLPWSLVMWLYSAGVNVSYDWPQDPVVKAQTDPYIPPTIEDEYELKEWMETLAAVLTYAPHDQRKWAVAPWTRFPTLFTASNFNELEREGRGSPCQELALFRNEVRELVDNHTPRRVPPGDWHLPFVRYDDIQEHTPEELIWVSYDRCLQIYPSRPVELLGVEKTTSLCQRGPAGHASLAIGYGHPSTVRGWQTLRFFIEEGSTPYVKS